MAKIQDKASVLAFEKKFVPSDAYMYGTNWNNRNECTPLKLQEKSVRGTISNRLKAAVKNDPAKLNAEVEKPNLQKVDACALAIDQDTLKLHFTLKVLSGVEEPTACNNAAFKQSYTNAAKTYIDKTNFSELAKRYAINLANGRFLWRNRVGAENILIEILSKGGNEQSWKFDATRYSMRDFNIEDAEINSLANAIAGALSNMGEFLLLEINAYVQVGNAQDIYPSEELVLDKGKGNKSKILFDISGIAAMHSQKIGNAIRTIDTWYPEFTDSEQSVGPIAIEPYGAVTNLGKAFRTPKDKKDFYTFFDKWARGEELENIDEEHYVMATLVRGGVFGESDK